MHELSSTVLPQWKVTLLVAMTLVVVGAAHYHSGCAALREMRDLQTAVRWRRVVSYLARHHLHYARRVPLMIFFVASSVVIVATL
jgi:hypothetical protein